MEAHIVLVELDCGGSSNKTLIDLSWCPRHHVLDGIGYEFRRRLEDLAYSPERIHTRLWLAYVGRTFGYIRRRGTSGHSLGQVSWCYLPVSDWLKRWSGAICSSIGTMSWTSATRSSWVLGRLNWDDDWLHLCYSNWLIELFIECVTMMNDDDDDDDSSRSLWSILNLRSRLLFIFS